MPITLATFDSKFASTSFDFLFEIICMIDWTELDGVDPGGGLWDPDKWPRLKPEELSSSSLEYVQLSDAFSKDHKLISEKNYNVFPLGRLNIYILFFA